MITLNHIIVDLREERIRFKGQSNEKIKSLLFYYQQIKEYKHPKITIEVPVRMLGGYFQGEISLVELYKKMLPDASTTWNILAKGKSNTFEINTDTALIQQLGTVDVLPMLTLSLGMAATAQLKLNFVPIRAKIETFNTQDKLSIISGLIESNVGQLDGHEISLQAKRRPNSTLYNFHEEKYDFPIKNLNNKNKFEFELNWEKLPQTFYTDDTNVCDFVIKITNEYGHEVTSFIDLPQQFTKEMIEKQIHLSKSAYIVKPYITGSRRLSFFAIRNNKNQVELVSFLENDTHFYLELFYKKEFVKNEDLKLVLKRKDKKGITFEYLVEMGWNNVKDMIIEIPKISFLSIPGIIHAGSWDFFLRVDEADYYITVPDSITLNSEYIYVQDQNFKAKVFKSPAKILSCYTILSDKTSPNAINIAVMGTCFSRNMFNSGLYFNPGYKQVLNCAFTQFHSSIISVMTEPFKFNLDQYTDMSSSEKNFVKEDFSKTFFENLKASNAEYFLIDLYPDVIRPVIWVSEKSAVTLSYVVEDSELLNDLPVKRIIDHIDNVAYFNEWKNYADAFIQKLSEIIPPERIIINKGRFTTSYYDKGHNKTEFPNKMMIERNNYFWDKLDNYFQSKLPNAQLLDIRHMPYMGDINYPYGNSFSHYESTYYKELFKELSFIILKERLNRL